MLFIIPQRSDGRLVASAQTEATTLKTLGGGH